METSLLKNWWNYRKNWKIKNPRKKQKQRLLWPKRPTLPKSINPSKHHSSAQIPTKANQQISNSSIWVSPNPKNPGSHQRSKNKKPFHQTRFGAQCQHLNRFRKSRRTLGTISLIFSEAVQNHRSLSSPQMTFTITSWGEKKRKAGQWWSLRNQMRPIFSICDLFYSEVNGHWCNHFPCHKLILGGMSAKWSSERSFEVKYPSAVHWCQ